MQRLAAFLLIALGLTGCFRFDGDGVVTETVGRAVDLVFDRPKPPMHAEPPVYCYRTIGNVDCAAEPALGDERRLVGHVGPRPF